MNRRKALRALIGALCAAPGAWPLVAHGQAHAQRVALVIGASEVSQVENVKFFREGM